MSENKDESNSTPSDVKDEEKISKIIEETKALDELSKDIEKESVKEDSAREEAVKAESEKAKDDSGDDDNEDEEEEVGLLDRPVEVTGCRARKKVERLEVSFATPKEKTDTIPEGKGRKLGEIARIDFQITKTAVKELKTLHRILFGRVGGANKIKRNLRQFSGFTFGNNSPEYEKKKAQLEKIILSELKQLCGVLDLERSGTKEEISNRLLDFLLKPKDSGKKVPQKKVKSKEKKPSAKKVKSAKAKKSTKDVSSDEKNSENDEASNKEDPKSDSDAEVENDSEPKKSAKKTSAKTVAKKSEKKEKPKKEEKKNAAKPSKRKRDDSDENSEEEPVSKKSKVPSDDEIRKLIKKILDDADLEEITMKKVIKQVADNYPDCDLSHKKAFIKSTIKSVIS